MSRHLGLANQHIARAVMTSSEKDTFSSFYVPFLSMTGNGMQDQVAENLQKFAPRRSGNTGIWIQPFGRLISQGDQGGITGYKSKMSGLLIGGDHKINPRTIVGASLGYALSTSELNGNTGKSQIKNKLFTTFAKYNADSWYVEGILTLNKNRLRSGRVVNPTNVATSTHDGIEAIPSLGFGYKTKIAELDLIPYLTTTLLWNQEDGYVENGAGAKNLTIRKRISSQLQGEAGLNATKIHSHDFGQATYGASLGILVSTPLKKGPITGTVLGTGFGVESNDSTHTYGIAKLSSQFALEEDWYVSATLAGEFGTRYQAYEGGITFRM
jgi:outer membrane autotransporter protein